MYRGSVRPQEIHPKSVWYFDFRDGGDGSVQVSNNIADNTAGGSTQDSQPMLAEILRYLNGSSPVSN